MVQTVTEEATIYAMKTTIDTWTGTRFRYNSVCLYRLKDGSEWYVPERQTSRSATWLHPGRVPPKLLAELNPGRPPYVCPPLTAE